MANESNFNAKISRLESEIERLHTHIDPNRAQVMVQPTNFQS